MKVTRSDGSPVLSIHDSLERLAQAELAFEANDEEYRRVCAERSQLLQKVNEAQDAVDAALRDLQGFAPPSSKWGIRQRSPGGTSS